MIFSLLPPPITSSHDVASSPTQHTHALPHQASASCRRVFLSLLFLGALAFVSCSKCGCDIDPETYDDAKHAGAPTVVCDSMWNESVAVNY